MQTPLQITFRSIAHSEALENHVRSRAQELSHIFDRIISCHVVIELAGHHHSSGDAYRVSVHVELPGHELTVSDDPPEDRNLSTAQLAADRAFEGIARQLEHWTDRQRRDRHDGADRQ